MKIASGALAALLLAGIGWSSPAPAQGVPQGTYLRSCSNIGVQGDSLTATCRRSDGREQRTTLSGVRRCVGDIGNSNGVLQCTYPGGAQARGQAVPEPGPGPGYGAPRYGEQPPGYGNREGYGSDRAERCRRLHYEAEELRARLDREWNPLERARTEGRLQQVREQQERCR